MRRLFGGLGRLVCAGTLVWCAWVETVGWFANRLFGLELDGDWFLILAASDANEVSRFFRLYAGALAGYGMLFLFLSAVLAWAALRLKGRGLLLLGAAFVLYGVHGAWSSGSLRAWKPLYVAYDTVRGTGDYLRLALAGEWTEERAAAVRPAESGAPSWVLVLGESLTSDRMGLYGYGRDTTPKLSALEANLAVLGPVRAPYPDTARALRALLVRDGETLAVRCRLNGYRTVLLSAQAHWERYCGIEQMIFAACEKRVYLGDEAASEPYDMALLPRVRQELEADDGRPLALFVHLMGSHFVPGERVPPDYAAGLGLDDYDRSVRQTDEVLAGIIAQMPPNTRLVFLSDHGESVDCSSWRDVRSSALWRVPLLVWPASSAMPVAAGMDAAAALSAQGLGWRD